MAVSKHTLIENVQPAVDNGRYAAKSLQGTLCRVEADVFRDGHDAVHVTLRWRHEASKSWSEQPMNDTGNDRWAAEFWLDSLGHYEFKVQAWSESESAGPGQKPLRDDVESAVFTVVSDRPLAVFGSWYELFVRSQGTDPNKVGTFKDAANRLDDIKSLGFDVIYLAPIHPIGRTARKGPNSSLTAGPNDPGSPWAVGNEHGGHTAVDRDLGTMKDFDDFVRATREKGMEVALDFAPHCSPDHPWVKEHPEWFYIRPDGTIKCHENPPYKYEDVYPLNFDSPNQAALYKALRDVFLFWVKHGVTLFRIDNPHTKPLAFWEWVIREVKRAHPEVVFLGEAFTRPKMMKALSKAGFSQSYTYFIWRTSKPELIEYITELSQPEMVRYFRPNFFATTPDVLPASFQTGGRSIFEIRAALAATLAPAYGIISGYELCENEGMAGTEEYANSEKFQVRVRDWKKPGNIRDTIAKLNQIRRDNVSLQAMDNIFFMTTPNDKILAYAKATPDRANIILAAVNLDPHQVQEGAIEIPMDKIGLSWEAEFEAQELMTNTTHRMKKTFSVRLDPNSNPFQLFRIKR